MSELGGLFDLHDTPLQKIESSFLKERGIDLFVKREELNHSGLSGNKLHKLKYNLYKAKEEGHNTLLTFGGAYSNHIYAATAAGKAFGFKTIGIIRGEEHLPLNPTLKFAVESGMRMHYMSRSQYRLKHTTYIIEQLKSEFGNFYLIPEGGTNNLAVKGCAEIIDSIKIDFDIICTACGTGGTLAGLIAGLNGNRYAMGFSVLKGASFLNNDVKNLLINSGYGQLNNWNINLDYHFGGYAKINSDLVSFVNSFEKENGIMIEPIYTGKMLFGLYDLISKNKINEGSKIIALHTGGLQGLAGLMTKYSGLYYRINTFEGKTK